MKMIRDELMEFGVPAENLIFLDLDSRYCPQKIDEIVRMGIGTHEELSENFFGPIKPEEKRKTLRQIFLKFL